MSRLSSLRRSPSIFRLGFTQLSSSSSPSPSPSHSSSSSSSSSSLRLLAQRWNELVNSFSGRRVNVKNSPRRTDANRADGITADMNAVHARGALLNVSDVNAAEVENIVANSNFTYMDTAGTNAANMNGSVADINGANMYAADINGANKDAGNINSTYTDVADMNGANKDAANINGAHADATIINGTYTDAADINGSDTEAADATATYYASLNISELESEVKEKGIVLPHDRQRFNWDCGIACAKMILKYFGKNESGSELASYFAAANLNTSVWTIDLAYLLTHFRVSNRMSTLTLGVDANYVGIDFYASHLREDDRRVDALFREARLNGVVVAKEAVSRETIVSHLERSRSPILILIDWKRMGCLHCGGGLYRRWKDRRRDDDDVVETGGGGGAVDEERSEEDEKDEESGASDSKKKKNVGYQGHFIVLTGVDRRRNVVYFSNPSASSPVCVAPIGDLEKARKSYGTDEDIIFVYDQRRDTQSCKANIVPVGDEVGDSK